jgi:hypothetical protein
MKRGLARRNHRANGSWHVGVLNQPPDRIAQIEMAYVLPGKEKPTCK